MSSAEQIVYENTEEASVPLTQENYSVVPQKKGCNPKAKVAIVAAALIAIGLTATGLYIGLSKEKVAKKPSYSVKYALAAN